MPRKHRLAKRRTDAPTVPVEVLHTLVYGEFLGQEDGERLYGPDYAWIEWPHPRDFEKLWRQHRDEIEAHARALGLPRSWAAAQFSEEITSAQS